METAIKAGNFTAKASTPSFVLSKEFNEQLEFNRYGIACVLIVLIGCLGGIAASLGTHGVIGLLIVGIPTSVSLAFILAIAPMRLVIGASITAMLIDLIMLILQ